jgi:hypothetical protein
MQRLILSACLVLEVPDIPLGTGDASPGLVKPHLELSVIRHPGKH